MRVVGMSWLPPACPRSATWGARATLYWPWPPATRAGEADRPSPEEHDGVEGSWFADGDREIGYRIFHVYGGFYFFGKNCISQSWQSFFLASPLYSVVQKEEVLLTESYLRNWCLVWFMVKKNKL
jgi:hypothetical protein